MEARELTKAIWEMQTRIDQLEAERRRVPDTEKLQNLILTAKQVSQMHGVSVRTVQSYASAGRIPMYPGSTEHKMLFRACDAVMFDFPAMMREKRRQTMFVKALS